MIDVEHDQSQQRWHAAFEASYVEKLSRKTGNFKKFEVFFKMLTKALKQPNNNIFADLLTAKDLVRPRCQSLTGGLRMMLASGDAQIPQDELDKNYWPKV